LATQSLSLQVVLVRLRVAQVLVERDSNPVGQGLLLEVFTLAAVVEGRLRLRLAQPT
jgi:hypothetical protein